MLDVIAFATLLTGAAGGFLYWIFRREHQQAEENFRRALRHELKRTRLKNFEFDRFVDESGVSRKLAQSAALDIFAQVYGRAIADGEITDAEQSRLDRLSTALHISKEARANVERKAKSEHYRNRLDAALADGVLTEEETAELRDLQASLGLSRQQVHIASQGLGRDVYLAHFRSMATKGVVRSEDMRELAKLRGSMGLSDHEALEIIRNDALDLYREIFYEAKQDGQISQEEEQQLNALQKTVGLSETDVAPYRKEVEWIRYLDRCRNGDLPTVSTDKILEGGEICHADKKCTYIWETRTSRKEASGELTITDRRIIFTSAYKSFEFRPAKIVDIEFVFDGLRLQTTGRRGTGWYLVSQPEELEAILYALVRKQKYLKVEGFSSSASRHIPGHVKQEVWARDGGKCVQCGATDYLEFDHIIPHAKGGANTVKNIQILCRKCNSYKADRI